ncbi:hypothetical protein CMQ_37 [Grosmannia clavigera kw1407]|uniref:Uncharacterized protein n=1 Tax=Grosmannia clavigera (strain kw1407 / UAMH 11150) TaxID=655863 RepID=F0XRC9_GROCL|nr:uncharacterized protein CMQ_37 [Grosmannia clavigera kw1407]EFW99719.1 hypothetical protein CMQ_37 [Grosmannia clavigera kw1407]
MTAFLEDPRLRQRWNQISQNAEAVTENAAAGIWTFQHRYITPCLGSISGAVDSCTGVCLGDRDERARRQRELARGAHRTRAEYSFDFYDDWYDDYYGSGLGESGDGGADGSGGGGGGIFSRGFFSTWAGSSRAEDWDRLLAGSGAEGSGEGDEGGGGDGGGHHTVDSQPRPRRSMSYGTGGVLRRTTDGADHRDSTIIPSTAPLGFLGRLPFKIGGTLRYKPSAANLREHPAGGGRDGHDMATRDEHQPLLGGTDGDHGEQEWQSTLAAVAAGTGSGLGDGTSKAIRVTTTTEEAAALMRKRSGTTGSGDTSDSFRSRGDLFASDEEGDEDAVPLDDEFAVALDRVDDRSSGRTRFSSSSSTAGAAATTLNIRRKGKRRADTATSGRSAMSRSVSYTTISGISGISGGGTSSQNSPAASIRPRISTTSLSPRGGGTTAAQERLTEEVDAEHDASDHEAEADEDVVERLQREEARAAQEEDAEVERKRRAAVQLARERGLVADVGGETETQTPQTAETVLCSEPKAIQAKTATQDVAAPELEPKDDASSKIGRDGRDEQAFVPARLPHFG